MAIINKTKLKIGFCTVVCFVVLNDFTCLSCQLYITRVIIIIGEKNILIPLLVFRL